ncbi:hypothetical protein BTJ40_04230 [Microbulbifer sp. A4B17]|uniref:hypothetical protein n=1 Tax=Microbulbifer sp. A4B17 TaxID=359370 RepID=UPI000D52B3A7|nr:hypothetical protein [Microbulbifer sp. A4B17]AWF80087.1 hypothetical protein BTJ40_04230 [Microbulbifer sp. A4B17]
MPVIHTVTFTQNFLNRHQADDQPQAAQKATDRWNSGENIGSQQTILIDTVNNLSATILNVVAQRGDISAVDVQVVIDQNALISTRNHGVINNQLANNYTVTVQGQRNGNNLQISHLESF